VTSMEGFQKSQKGHEREKMILGIEFGSTRIKAILIDQNHEPIVSGSHEWENQYVNDFWTYSIESIWGGLARLLFKVGRRFQSKIPTTINSGLGYRF